MALRIKLADRGGIKRGVHHAILDQQHPVFDRVDQREIAVDDEIEDCIEDIVGAVREFGGQGFETRAHFAVRARRAVADRDDEMAPHKNRGFARLDRSATQVAGAGDDK